MNKGSGTACTGDYCDEDTCCNAVPNDKVCSNTCENNDSNGICNDEQGLSNCAIGTDCFDCGLRDSTSAGGNAKCSTISDHSNFCDGSGANGLKDNPGGISCSTGTCEKSNDASTCCKAASATCNSFSSSSCTGTLSKKAASTSCTGDANSCNEATCCEQITCWDRLGTSGNPWKHVAQDKTCTQLAAAGQCGDFGTQLYDGGTALTHCCDCGGGTPICSNTDGSGINDDSCKCGSNTCTAVNGLMCTWGQDKCEPPPTCSNTGASGANSGICQCGVSVCTSATGLFCNVNTDPTNINYDSGSCAKKLCTNVNWNPRFEYANFDFSLIAGNPTSDKNSEDCQCGDTQCTAETGRLCDKSENKCWHAPCSVINGNSANSEDCACNMDICTAATGRFCKIERKFVLVACLSDPSKCAGITGKCFKAECASNGSPEQADCACTNGRYDDGTIMCKAGEICEALHCSGECPYNDDSAINTYSCKCGSEICSRGKKCNKASSTCSAEVMCSFNSHDFSSQASGTYNLPSTGCKLANPITLVAGKSFTLTGVANLDVNKLRELQAPNGNPDSDGVAHRHFHLSSTGTQTKPAVTLKYVKLTWGRAGYYYESGGSIYMKRGTLTMLGSAIIFYGLSAKEGGALYAEGDNIVVIEDSTFEGTQTYVNGGGIFINCGKDSTTIHVCLCSLKCGILNHDDAVSFGIQCTSFFRTETVKNNGRS